MTSRHRVGLFHGNYLLIGSITGIVNFRGSRFSNAESALSKWVKCSCKGGNSCFQSIANSFIVFSLFSLLAFLFAASTSVLCLLYTSKIFRKRASIFLRISNIFDVFSSSNLVVSRSTLVLSRSYFALSKSYFVFAKSYVNCLTVLSSALHQSLATMPHKKRRTASPSVRSFRRFAAFSRRFHVVFTLDLLSPYRSLRACLKSLRGLCSMDV